MKKTFNNIAASAFLAVAMAGCMADAPFYTSGEGTLYLSTKIKSDVEVASRADVAELASTCDIWIANEKGVVRQFDGTDAVPANGIKLVAGNYKAMVWAGDSVPASWTDRFFKGTTVFTIENGDNKTVDLVGKLANSVVSVDFDQTVSDVLTDFKMTVGHSQGKLVYDANTDAEARGYFMLNSRDHDLTWTLTGTRLDGSEYTRTGTIVAPQAAYLYTLKVYCTEDNTEFGGAYLTVEVDESAIEKEFDITIDAAPEIKGIDFDIAQTLRAEEHNMGKRSVWITATNEIKSLVLTCDYFDQLFGFDGENDFDFFQMTNDELRKQIENEGISYTYETNPQDDGLLLPTIKLTFGTNFTDNLPEGHYNIGIDVTDIKGKRASAILRLVISDAPISVAPVDVNDVWATHATVSVSVEKDDVNAVVIKYRKKGSSSWDYTAQPSALSRSTVFTAVLTDLEPGTTYEYCGATDEYETPVEEFTTEAAAQLPNNSFENWHQDGKPYVLYEAGGTMFWDSGNHGSTTISASGNITTPETTMVHSGSTAVAMTSKKIVIQFAAGNMFAGKFLGVDGTDGVLGWGRPFTSRPRQLKVWAHYAPAKIDNTSTSAPEYVKGEPDKGVIYVALLDDHTETYKGETFPVVIKTKASERRLFNAYGSDKEHVIAYGEHIFDENSPATNASGLVEITVDLDYESFGKNLRPSYILLTASSSKGGDYFAGGANSKLVLDDIQLVY